jgi:hypothetical protein
MAISFDCNCALKPVAASVKQKKKKKKQIDNNHAQEGIRRGHKPTGQSEGARDGKWRTNQKA